MPKPRVAVYGLTTEGYRLAATIIDRADVTVIDETLQMAMELNQGFLKRNPDLSELMSQEPLLSLKPLEQVLGGAQLIFFTPRLRRPSEESLIEAGTKLRDLSRYLSNGVTLVNNLPTGPGGNSENIMMVEKQTGLRVGQNLGYSYMPLKPGDPQPGVVSNAGGIGRPLLDALGLVQNSQNVFAAELEYASTVLEGAIGSVTQIELARKSREAKVVLKESKEVFIHEFSKYLYDLRAIQASEETGESISYLAGATLKSLENFVRYVVDETREVLKDKELKASRTKITLLWSLDRYEMRADRPQMAESIQQRLKDYVTDVDIVANSRLNGISDIIDTMKHNVVIACSKEDYETFKQIRRSHAGSDATVIRATPWLTRE